MKVLLGLGTTALILSALCFYAGRKSDADTASVAVERVLKAEARSLPARFDDALLKADRDALLAATRWRKKPPLRSYLSDTALAEPESPKWVIVAGRRVRAAGLVDDPLLEDALDAHLSRAERIALYNSRGKSYLFVRGTLPAGQPYAEAYSPESFFSDFQSAEGLRTWIVGRDGTVIFHPLQRFVGSNVSNLRPVASGLQRLAAGKNEQYSQRYLGLEGKESLGSWAVLPAQGVLIATELPRDVAAAGGGWLGWLALLLSWCGVGLLAAGLRRMAPESSVPVEPLFDTGRLDDDAIEYLERAKSAADEAIELARTQEESAELARRERARATGEVHRLEAKIALLEAFQNEVLPKLTGKQVWGDLARLISERAPGLTVTVYRYSPSSFSLVPDGCYDGAAIPDNALAYLRDSRIFIGNPNLIPNVTRTEAFHKWNRVRERHMPLHRTEFRVFPLEAQGGKGILLVAFDERINEQGELEDFLQLTGELVERAGTFCDSLTPLIQSPYAKANAGPHLASAPNGVGNRPRPS